MIVWISKYALTKGIFDVEAELCNHDDMIRVDSIGFYHGKGREWHTSKEEAILKANEMKLKKIEALKKQIAKLEKMSFED